MKYSIEILSAELQRLELLSQRKTINFGVLCFRVTLEPTPQIDESIITELKLAIMTLKQM